MWPYDQRGHRDKEVSKVFLFSLPDHKFFFAKMNIMNIYVLDFFGGAAKVDINEYFSAAIP